MTAHDIREPIDGTLKQLARVVPDSRQAERVRMRCHIELGQRRKRAARAAAITGVVRNVVVPLLVGGFSVAYIAALVIAILR